MMAKILTEADITALVRSDERMLRALRVARELDLPDWWIGAGFLRNKIWDEIQGVPGGQATDIDLVYFNQNDIASETDWNYDKHLRILDPEGNWEVRNQARMHYVNGLKPFVSTQDGISHWTETATAIGVKLDGEELRFLFCYGTDDLLNMIARPTPHLLEDDKISIFHNRMKKKKWQERWPGLRVELGGL